MNMKTNVGGMIFGKNLKARFSSIVLSFLTIIIVTGSAYAQQEVTITGQVTDANNEPLPGVNVLVKGTNLGTSTDVNGRYAININGNVILIFSMIGFKDIEVKTGNYDQNNIDMTLYEETIGLDELTVVGYSEVETRHIASSVAEIDMGKIETQSISKMEEAFSGTIPGVVMMQENNIPGEFRVIFVSVERVPCRMPRHW